MARLLVVNDDLTARVEIIQNDEDGAYSAVCTCGPGDLLSDAGHVWSERDATQIAANHIDNHH